jgi:hypothetical protein
LKEGEIEIAKEATTIRPAAFYMCTKITSIIFEEGGTEDFKLQDSYYTWSNKQTLGVGTTLSSGLVFFGCTSLKSIAFPARLTELGAYSLASYVGTTSSVNGVVTYPYALNINSITFADGCKLAKIGQNAFDSMFGLTSIILPDELTTVETNAFNACKNLKDITLGKSMDATAASATVTSLTALETVNVAKDSTLLSTDDHNILYDYNKEILVYCPIGYTGNFEVPATVKTIATSAFANVAGLGAVTFAASTEDLEIQGYAFQNSGITSIVLPSRVNALGTISSTSAYSYTFKGCENLTTVTFDDGYSYASIPSGMFQGCTALKEIYLPYKVSLIGAFAFEGCTSLKTVEFVARNDKTHTSELTYVGQSAFKNCSSLTSITIPDTVKMLGAVVSTLSKTPTVAITTSAYTFAGCTSLTSVHLPTAITIIPQYSFNGCTSLSTINVPASVTSIGMYAFQSCTELSSFDLTNVTTLGNFAFKGAGLTSVTIPKTLTTLGTNVFQNNVKLNTASIPTDAFATLSSYTFDGCTLLTDVTFTGDNKKLTTIDTSAFKGTGIVSITIPVSVTTINKLAFSGCTSLTTFSIAARTAANLVLAEATSGNGIFDGCTSLASVDLSYVSIVGAYNFEGCTALATVTRSADYGAATISQYVFEGCTALSSVQLENVAFTYLSGKTTKASTNIFDGCTSLTNMAFEKNKEGYTNYIVCSTTLTALPNYMFNGCSSLSDIALPSGLTSIGTYAFKNCAAITEFTIPTTVTTIGANAFQYSGITSVTIPASVTSMGNSVFANCASLTTVVYESSAFTGTNIFADCSSLSSVTLSGNITHIGTYAFKNCTSLKSIQLPSTLKQLGATSATYSVVASTSAYVFQNCTALEEIVIPDGVTVLGYGVFEGCTSLKNVHLGNVTTLGGMGSTSYTQKTTFAYCTDVNFTKNDSNTTLTISDDKHALYVDNVLYTYTGTDEEVVIADGTTEIGGQTFRYNTTMKKVTIPSTVTTILGYAFAGCEELTDVDIASDSQLTTIGTYAFSNAQKLTSINLSSTCDTVSGKTTVKAIGSYAFNNCYELVSVKLGSGTVDTAAFINCTSLTSIDFGEVSSLTGSNIFKGCTALTKVTVPDTVTVVGLSIFEGCTSLKEATINCGTAVKASNSWFKNCTALETVTFAAGIENFGNYMFQGCSSLVNVTLPSTLLLLSAGYGTTFKDCTSLEEITLPKGITAIYASDFSGCTNLKTVTAEGKITYIANNAFADCVNLTLKGFDFSEITYIGVTAFKNCASLTSISLPSLIGFSSSSSSTKVPTSTITVSTIAEVFAGCTSLTTVSMPNVTLLQKGLFNGCTALTEVITGDVTAIGDEAFKDCSSLTSFDLSSVTSIGANAFEGCTAIEKITIYKVTTTISANAFAGWTEDQCIEIPDFGEAEQPSGWSDDWATDCEATISSYEE